MGGLSYFEFLAPADKSIVESPERREAHTTSFL